KIILPTVATVPTSHEKCCSIPMPVLLLGFASIQTRLELVGTSETSPIQSWVSPNTHLELVWY
ncbi:hypothetical protein RIF25_14400, partial [Thermosynechococcaceae cyanobacterium BACA0444]